MTRSGPRRGHVERAPRGQSQSLASIHAPKPTEAGSARGRPSDRPGLPRPPSSRGAPSRPSSPRPHDPREPDWMRSSTATSCVRPFTSTSTAYSGHDRAGGQRPGARRTELEGLAMEGARDADPFKQAERRRIPERALVSEHDEPPGRHLASRCGAVVVEHPLERRAQKLEVAFGESMQRGR